MRPDPLIRSVEIRALALSRAGYKEVWADVLPCNSHRSSQRDGYGRLGITD
jgi:hypothetical protein